MKKKDEIKIDEGMTVEFAPGCFDSFEGSQEELDAFVNEIKTALQNMTPEELEENAVELNDEELANVLNKNKLATKIISELANLEQRKLH